MSLDAVFGFADSGLHFCHRRKASEKTSTGLGHKASEVLRSPSRVRDVAHLRERLERAEADPREDLVERDLQPPVPPEEEQ